MFNFKKCIKLFLNALYMSAFTFGGGFVIISFIKKIYVDKYGWLTKEEMSDINTIALSTPGANAVNANILLGYKICGFWGAIFATLGTILPPLVIISLLSLVYDAFISNALVGAILYGMQFGVVAILIDVCLSIGKVIFNEKNYWAYLTIPATFLLIYFLNINIFIVVLPTIALAILIYYYKIKTGKINPELKKLSKSENQAIAENLESQTEFAEELSGSTDEFDNIIVSNQIDKIKPSRNKEAK